MKYKVIFDTSAIRNANSASEFLGSRSDLSRFLEVAEIIIPEMVIEEIKSQKRKSLVKKRKLFLENPFHFLRKINEGETKSFDIEKWIEHLIGEERIPYRIILLTKNCLVDMKNLCLRN